MTMRKKQHGFTLIELLIVIAIIAILAAIIIATTTSARLQARDSRRAADLDEVRTALEMYFNKEGHYPAYSTCNNTSFSNMCNDLITAGYLSTVPKDPKGGSYQYMYSGNSDAYVLKAVFETNATAALKSDYDENYVNCTCNGDDNDASASNYDYCIINP